ncbi:hypothetical protein ACSW9I_06125 [Clostridium perfringens]|uniref:hypothetical protein n=1 Tax=Clostridium perfringens TaxID=1502 RepID=UPI0024BD249D|nr:hypothetical protein [Clostridium perfringens]
MNLETVYKVYIIESPSADDLMKGITEGQALTKILELSNIQYEYFLVTTKEVFEKALVYIKEDVLELQEEKIFVWPIIHISCHGNEECIGLTNNEFINWSTLEKYLSIVNVCFEEADPVSPIILSMSSCCGLNAIKSDWVKNHESSPFSFVLGHENEIPWDDALIAFSVFYHNFINKELDPLTALKCMNDSINSENYFKLFSSTDCYKILSGDENL